MNQPQDNDDEIKLLLLSDDSSQRHEGLKLLDETYRIIIWAFVRHWNKKSLLTLDEFDIDDIWEATLLSVYDNVEEGNFEFEGCLLGYLWRIAHRRAVDAIRRVMRFEAAINEKIKLLGEGDPPNWSSEQLNEIMEVVKKMTRLLPKGLKSVIEIDIEIFLKYYDWPSYAELTDEYNNRYPDQPLTENAVKSRRARGRKRLRILLRDKI